MKQQKPPLTKLKFIKPMYARLVNELPGRPGMALRGQIGNNGQIDGYRCLAGM
jgi:hypothetical protein